MNRAVTLATAVGLLTLAIGSTWGSAAAGSESAIQLGDHEPQHTLTFNRAINAANKVARRECNRTSDCIGYGSLECHSSFRHKWTCPIHIVRGVPGDPSLQQDCHRDAKIFIKAATGLFWYYRFLNPYVCGANVEHPGF